MEEKLQSQALGKFYTHAKILKSVAAGIMNCMFLS